MISSRMAAWTRQQSVAPCNSRSASASISRPCHNSPLASNWETASTGERQKFTALFRQLIQSSYAGKLEAYTNETVVYPTEKTHDKKALVETLIKTASADIPVNYRLYQKDGEWLVYDVVIEGVSLVSNYRSSYHAIIGKEGLDGLMLKMQEKLKELEAS